MSNQLPEPTDVEIVINTDTRIVSVWIDGELKINTVRPRKNIIVHITNEKGESRHSY